MTDVDDYSEPEGEPKEEPDCYSCNDSGCPDCGHIDPADPTHQQYLAARIIDTHLGRIAGAWADADEQQALIDAAMLGITDGREALAAALKQLLATVTTSITWRDPSSPAPGYSTEQPF